MSARTWLRRWLALCAAAFALLTVAVLPATASAKGGHGAAAGLRWSACATEGAPTAQCATARLPRDYARPWRGSVEIAVVRIPATDPARRIGSLFMNFGGPGGTTVERLLDGGTDVFPTLADRFDLVGFDPRGVGLSRPSIDCRVNQETDGVYAQPFETPENLDIRAMIERDTRYIRRCIQLNGAILPYVSTANVARDMDRLRALVGDQRLTYLGFSYGTFLGATYASLFPGRARALVLDGALDPDQYVNDPLAALDEQTAGFERAIGRFLMACAGDQEACLGFGGEDPWAALDDLIARAYQAPIPAGDEAPVDGDDVNAAVAQAVYAKQLWPLLARGLAEASAGDASILRLIADAFYGKNDDGTYDPITDRYFAISALEQRYPRDVRVYLREGRRSYQDYDHAWWNHGYSELAWGLYPIEPNSAYYGPFRNPSWAAPALVVGTTYDPATPYKEARRLVRQLGNARLLTMRGDGHTAYGGNSACIDAAVDAYLEELALPAEGTVCQQEVPFEQPQVQAQQKAAPEGLTPAQRAATGDRLEDLQPRTKPLVR